MTSQEYRKFLAEELNKNNDRLDMYENFLTEVIKSIPPESTYTEAYNKAMNCALDTFRKLFEREADKND
jgi:hypothetical protein